MGAEPFSSWQASSWQLWALLSAVFAALTAIFAKVGVENISPDLATFIRTIVVLISFALLLFATGQFVSPNAVSAKTWTFLVLSGLATGASWLCYFRALKLGPATLVASPLNFQPAVRSTTDPTAAVRTANADPDASAAPAPIPSPSRAA